jgi:hypothetical protein
MWTDGVDFAKTGTMRHCWPIAISVIAVGSHYQGKHVLVPPEVCKPIMVGLYLGSTGKPENGNILLRQTVDELKVLDPRPRPEEHRVKNESTKAAHAANFTVSLARFLADTPARAVAKNIYGHNSLQLCEKCTVEGKRFPGMGTAAFQVQNLNLRTDDQFEEYLSHVREVGEYYIFCTSIGCGVQYRLAQVSWP